MTQNENDEYLESLALAVESAQNLAAMAELKVEHLLRYPQVRDDSYLRGQLNGISSTLLMISRICEDHKIFRGWLLDEKPESISVDQKEAA